MTSSVPSELAVAVEGCWNLAPQYRIVLRRAKQEMAVEQQTVDKQGKTVTRKDGVRYNPGDNTLQFTGIGNIHRVVVILRWSDGALDSAFNSEISPGKWLNGTWERAVRCSDATPQKPSSG
jgi:hypothetical protein